MATCTGAAAGGSLAPGCDVTDEDWTAERYLPLVMNILSFVTLVVSMWWLPPTWSLLCLLLVLSLSAAHYSYWLRHGVPQLLPLPPYGDMWGCVLLARDIGSQLSLLCQRSAKPLLGVYLLWRPALLARSPQAAAAVLRMLHGHGLAAGLPRPRGLFHLRGDEWARARKLLLPAFSGATLRAVFHQSLQPAAGRLARGLSCANRAGSEVDVHRLACDYAAEVFAEAVLGLPRLPGDRDHPALCELRAWARHRLRPSLFKFMPTALSLLAPMIASLLPRGPALPQEFVHIRSRVLEASAQAGDSEPRQDIATHFQKLQQEGLMSGEEASVHALLMFSGAMEATASALAYCLLELALNPAVQRHLRLELRAAQTTHAASNGRLPFDALVSLPYLHCIVHETLRKHPPLAMLNRMVPAGDPPSPALSLPGVQCPLEPGTAVVVPLTVLHHDPSLYPEPQRFVPERFAAAEARRRHPCAFLPFGGGPRACIGKRLGLLLMKTVVAELVLRFSLEPCSRTEAQPRPEPWAPALVPIGGLWLALCRIQNDSPHTTPNGADNPSDHLLTCRDDPALSTSPCLA